jgi:predicted DNA-binding transcriptional regulator AlpA
MGDDFISVAELALLTGFTKRTIYFQHSTQTGALAPILSKLGRRLGAWKNDYEQWKTAQYKLPSIGGNINCKCKRGRKDGRGSTQKD